MKSLDVAWILQSITLKEQKQTVLKSQRSQRLDLAEIKCGLLTKLKYELFTVFQGDWSEALNPGDVCGLLYALITPCTR